MLFFILFILASIILFIGVSGFFLIVAFFAALNQDDMHDTDD
jgi:hypothetical protein